MNSSQLPVSTATGLAADARALNALKLQAGQSSPAAIKETAKQFESLFMRELIKSMREATMKSGMLDGAQGDMATDMLDQQLAISMSGQPGGLSDLIAKQLSRQMGVNLDQAPAKDKQVSAVPADLKPASLPRSATPPGSTQQVQTRFVKEHQEVAARISRETGIPASYMIGQAAHETGWGRREIRMKDGSNSFNLFGIKPGANWTGKVAEVTTTEYINGVPRKVVSKFRAYDSYADAFRDYARLISESPRYAKVRQQTGSAVAFANSLQQAGYATDPEYANKLSRVINTTLRLQRAMT